jgi:Ca-activated chloride channel family protein
MGALYQREQRRRAISPRIGALLALCGLVLTTASAEQEPEAQADAPFREELSVGYVLVPIVVRSPKGFVRNLEPDDFRLSVDGQPVVPDSFESAHDAPVSLLFAQDLSGSMGMGPKLDYSRRAVEFFLQHRLPGDTFALSSFASGLLTVDVPYTDNVDVLREAITLWRGWGRTALHDAVAWLPSVAGERGAIKRAAILVTDGVDNASTFDPATARERVRAAQLPVYVIGLSTGDPYAVDTGGEKLYGYADVLNRLASLSGGGYHSATEATHVQAACRAILDELRHQYVLGFPTRESGSPSYREILVEVDGHKRSVSFRQGYHGGPPLGRTAGGSR